LAEEGAVREDTGVAGDAEWLNLRHRLTGNVAVARNLVEGREECLFTTSNASNVVRWRSSYCAAMKTRRFAVRTAAAKAWRSSSPLHT
jgi:hypothetical protein